MRQALGQLGTARTGKPDAAQRRPSHQVTPGAGRHRFRQDGEVPVVRASLAAAGQGGRRQNHAPAGPMAPASGQTGEGRPEGGGAETARQVLELAEQLRATLTRLGHAELALAEAGRAAQARADEAEGLRRALAEAEAALAQARAELAVSEQARGQAEQRQPGKGRTGLGADTRDDGSARRKAGRPLGSLGRARRELVVSMAEPVKWWTAD